ncbi:hypothetical protein BDN71DRAFT_1435718 [Pleurotus eryngii]|uniref:Uncharacterized protein n=1 Tax=Pleurotus eryngii TaxID=5323 RepID=A0A9P5ZKC3_PLEER|nr:hypothetical protein BDN71DRAFT_1435718 [Pleurotus eryngii]
MSARTLAHHGSRLAHMIRRDRSTLIVRGLGSLMVPGISTWYNGSCRNKSQKSETWSRETSWEGMPMGNVEFGGNVELFVVQSRKGNVAGRKGQRVSETSLDNATVGGDKADKLVTGIGGGGCARVQILERIHAVGVARECCVNWVQSSKFNCSHRSEMRMIRWI